MKLQQPNQRWPLTAKQQALYDYFVGEGGFHLTKTAKHFGKSLATIHQMLQRLVERGWLVNEKGKSPAYRPTSVKCQHDWAYNQVSSASRRECRLCGRVERRSVFVVEQAGRIPRTDYGDWALLIEDIDYEEKNL